MGQRKTVMTTNTTDIQAPDRSSREIEEEIRDRRGKMDETLGELGSRLTLRAFVQNALEWRDSPASGKAGSAAARQAVRSLARQVKAHPMPSLLIGGGLAWLIADGDDEPDASSRSGKSHPGNAIADGLRDAKEAAGEAMDSAKEKIAEAGHVVHDKAEQATHAIIEGSKTTVAKARTGLVDGYHASAEQFGKAVEEYPLGVGLAFAALGALVGLALPHTRKEDELMGKQSEAVVEAVKEKGEQLLETGKSVGARVMETVKEEAKEQGITPDKLADGIAGIAAKGAGVLAKAQTEASQALKEEGLVADTPESSSVANDTSTKI
jgi:hypothetical protein